MMPYTWSIKNWILATDVHSWITSEKNKHNQDSKLPENSTKYLIFLY